MAGTNLESERTSRIIIFLMTMLLTMHVFIPFASAADGMDTCDGNAGTCDDYNSSHDFTPNQQDWVNGTYDFKLVNTNIIELDLVWAIHEFDRSAIGLTGAPYDSVLATDGLDSEDGAPADLIRNYFDVETDGPGSPTVKDQLKTELNDALDTSMENGFGNIVGLTTDYTQTITQEGITTTCSDDPTSDSIYSAEGATENNVFQPPICLSSTFTIELTDTAFSLSSSGNLDLERAFQGMLVMGAEITTNFTLLTLPGHIGYYSFSPPDYADIIEVGAGGTLAARIGSPSYFAGEWIVDELDAIQGAADTETPISVKLGHRNRSSTSTVEIDNEAKAIDLNIKLDLRDDSAATIDFVAGLSYLDEEILTDWGISLFEVSDTATLPIVTSDGIRLAYHNGLVELEAFASAFPIDSIATGISDSVGGDEAIVMNDMYWVSDALTEGFDDPGGLNYTHSTGCSEVAQPGEVLHYCVEGSSAMSEEYPVYLRSSSQPFSMSLIDVLTNNFDDGDLTKYVEVLQESDLRNLLNSGLSIESILPSDYLDSVIPVDLPPSELTLEIILPSWVRTIDGEDRLIFKKSLNESQDLNVSLAGTAPYDWRNQIKDDDMNVICTTVQRTCITSSIDLDISALRINEWSQSVSLDFALDAEVSIYRVIVPLEKLEQDGSTKINFEAAPSDLVRVGLDIASRLAEPKTFDDVGSICKDDDDFEVCDTELSFQFTPDGLTEFSEDIGDIITDYIHAMGEELPNQDDSPFNNVDLSGFRLKTSVDGLSGLDQDIGDDEPITLSVKIPKVEFMLDVDGNYGEIAGGDTSSLEVNFLANAFRGLIINPLVSAAELLGTSLSNGIVSTGGITYPDSSGEPTSFSFDGNTSIAEEYGFSLTGPVSIILPRGITLEDIEDTGGYLEVEEIGGRQKITFNIPEGEFEDTITFRVHVSWLYLLMQFWVYPTFVILLLVLFIRRRRRKKKKKKERKVVNQQRATKVAVGDSEFADLKGFHSEGMHGELEQFEDYTN